MATMDTVDSSVTRPVPRRPALRRMSGRVGASVHKHSGLLGLALFLVIWEIVARSVSDPILLPPMSAVAADLWSWISSGEIFPDLRITLIELSLGYALGVAAGVAIGVVMALFEPIRRLIEPLIVGANAAPALAFAPLLLIWFGFGLSSKYVLVAFVSFFPVAVNTHAGIAGTDRSFLDVARSFNAGRLSVILKVRFPAALPLIIAGMRISITIATSAVFAAELFGASAGIGFSIYSASQVFDTARVFSGIAVLSVLGIGCASFLSWVGKKASPWYAMRKGAK